MTSMLWVQGGSGVKKTAANQATAHLGGTKPPSLPPIWLKDPQSLAMVVLDGCAAASSDGLEVADARTACRTASQLSVRAA